MVAGCPCKTARERGESWETEGGSVPTKGQGWLRDVWGRERNRRVATKVSIRKREGEGREREREKSREERKTQGRALGERGIVCVSYPSSNCLTMIAFLPAYRPERMMTAFFSLRNLPMLLLQNIKKKGAGERCVRFYFVAVWCVRKRKSSKRCLVCGCSPVAAQQHARWLTGRSIVRLHLGRIGCDARKQSRRQVLGCIFAKDTQHSLSLSDIFIFRVVV